MSQATAEIGIIGGSGLYSVEEILSHEEVHVRTPFGDPSDAFHVGEMGGRRVAFLARHGRGHRLLPGEINYRANIYAMKALGVQRILAAGAVGSMKEEIRPTHLVFPDQFIDLTKHRASTFFGDGVVAHVSMADPVCGVLRAHLARTAAAQGAVVHEGGTYLCMEGPQFSSRGESYLYRSWPVSVIGMTNATEAKLAREAEICYASMALATDYDCWHVEEGPVSVDTIIGYLHANAAMARRVVSAAVAQMPDRACGCGDALRDAIITDRAAIPARTRERLHLLLGRYLS